MSSAIYHLKYFTDPGLLKIRHLSMSCRCGLPKFRALTIKKTSSRINDEFPDLHRDFPSLRAQLNDEM